MTLPIDPQRAATPAQTATATAAQQAQASLKIQLAEAGIESGKVYQAQVQKLESTNTPPVQTSPQQTVGQPATPSATPQATIQQAILRINGHPFTVNTGIPLKLGQTLPVMFDAQLNLTTPKPQASNTQTLLSQLHQFSQRQRPMGDGLSALLQVLNSSQTTGAAKSTASPLLSNMQAFVNQLPTPDQVTSPTTRQLLQASSGAFAQTLQNLVHQIRQLPHAPDSTIPPESTAHTNKAEQLAGKDITAGRMKEVLQSSGLFLENKLAKALTMTRQNPASLQSFAPVEALEKRFSGNAMQATSSGPGSQAQSKTALLNVVAQILKGGKLDNLSGSLRLPPASAQINASGSPTPTGFADLQIGTDLKSGILSLIRQLGAHLPEAKLSQLMQQPALTPLQTLPPFAFPIIIPPEMRKASGEGMAELNVGELLKQLAGAIHRINHNQLHSLLHNTSTSPETSIQQSWHFDLPFYHPEERKIDILQVRIDQENTEDTREEKGSKVQSQWKLTLAFDFETLGAIFIQVNLRPPKISPNLWADKPSTLQLLQTESERFLIQLTALGLEVDDMKFHQGRPPTRKAQLDYQFIDTRA